VSPSHTYAAAGTYTVSLTVTNTSNLTGTATSKATIAVAPLPPTANAGGPYAGTVGTAVSFSGAGSTDPQSETLTYTWTFGDGGSASGEYPTHTYTASGTFNVVLIVTDSSGLSGSATSKATIAAAPVPPMANAGGPYAGTAGSSVSFSGAASSDPQGETLTYAWNFGDSTTGTGVSPTHTFATAGTYTVSLTVTDTSNLTATATSKATIAAAVLTDVALTGLVYGGATPIVGAHVYLFAANTTGYGGAGLAASSSNASVSLLSAAETGTSDSVGAYVATGSNGGFSLTGDYTCTSGQQLYLYALGGGNAAAGLMAAIGNCPASGSSAITVTVNEVSTIAAAYSFAGFATDATHVSSSGTALAQVGIANAFANAANLVSLLNGTALATTPAGNGTVPQTEINTLANILASCVDTVSSCSTLLATATADGTATGTKPTDTATAAINIAHHPGANIAALYGLATSVFTPALNLQPNEFSISLLLNGILNSLNGVAIDGSGNAWIVTGNGVVVLSNLGTVISGANGYKTGSGSIAIDKSGNAWVEGLEHVYKVSSTGSPLSGASGFADAGVGLTSLVYGLAIDGTGNAWISKSDYSTVTELSSSGTLLSGSNDYSGGGLNDPQGLAIDGSGNVWVTNYFGGVTELTNAGIPLTGSNGYTGAGLNIAVDGSGNAWVEGSIAITKLSNSGSLLSGPSGFAIPPTLNSPDGIAIDGAGNAWALNDYSVVEFSSSGVILSAPYGYAIATPIMGSEGGGVAIDGSGNVWAVTRESFTVTEIVGVATPVITPIAAGLPATPTANGSSKLGTRP
jgi:PKD repeat protein